MLNLRSWTVLVVVAVAANGSRATARDEDGPPLRKISQEEAKDQQKKRATATYLPLKKALETARREYKALVVYYDGGEQTADEKQKFSDTWRTYLENRSFRRTVEKLVLARLDQADLGSHYPTASRATAGTRDNLGGGRTVSRVLKVAEGDPTILLLDFRERELKRYVNELPSRTKLRRELRALFLKNGQFAARARMVDKAVEASRYAYKLGDSQAAVEKILPLLEPKERRQLDSVSIAKLEELEKGYRQEAREMFQEARTLEGEKKYLEAMELLEKLTKAFPFPDVIQDANDRRGAIFRKARRGL